MNNLFAFSITGSLILFKSFTFNDQLIEFYLNNLLGVDGLKIQKNIPAIRSMIYALREITNKNVSVYEHNRQSIMFNNLSDSAKAIIKSGFDMQEIEEHIFELQANKVPFKISDVDITSKELMELGVVNKALSKVFGLILFELISETIKNNKEDIVKFVTENLKDYIRK